MTLAAQHVVESFDALPDADKHEAAVQIMRRYSGTVVGDVPDAGLVEAADELFRALDAEEAIHASR